MDCKNWLYMRALSYNLLTGKKDNDDVSGKLRDKYLVSMVGMVLSTFSIKKSCVVL